MGTEALGQELEQQGINHVGIGVSKKKMNLIILNGFGTFFFSLPRNLFLIWRIWLLQINSKEMKLFPESKF